jgi:chromosome segregation ATPase
VQAHSLAEERERLIAELATVRNETIRDTVEREEEYKRELQQTVEEKDAELAALARTHAAEIARVTTERESQIIAMQQSLKAAEITRNALDDQIEQLRTTLKTVQREASELKERVAALESDKHQAVDAAERGKLELESLREAQRTAAEQLEANAAEIRRNTAERRKFVAYLEEGLALLGALPPTADAADKAPEEGD